MGGGWGEGYAVTMDETYQVFSQKIWKGGELGQKELKDGSRMTGTKKRGLGEIKGNIGANIRSILNVSRLVMARRKRSRVKREVCGLT